MDVLVVGEVIGMGAVVVMVAVAVAVVVAGAVVVVGAVIVVGVVIVAIVVGDVGVVGGGRKDCTEAGWRGGTRGGIVGVEGVGVDDPTFGIGEDSRMGTFVGHGRNRKMRQRSGAAAAQGARTAACRYVREIAREGFDGVVVGGAAVVVVVAVAVVSRLAVGSSFGRLDVVALHVGCFSSCLAANVVIEWPMGFGLFPEAMRLVPHAPGSKGRS